jgi:hypothetical protein
MDWKYQISYEKNNQLVKTADQLLMMAHGTTYSLHKPLL